MTTVISHESYTDFLKALKCDRILYNNTWNDHVKNIKNKCRTYYGTYNSNFFKSQSSIKFFKESDLISKSLFDQDSIIDVTSQGFELLSGHCFKLFDNISTIINVAINKEELIHDFESFKNIYDRNCNNLFVEMEQKNLMLNIFEESLTSSFNWMALYTATEYSESFFKIIFLECNLKISELVEKRNNLSLSTYIAFSTNLNVYIELIGKHKFLELVLFSDIHILQFLILKKHLQTFLQVTNEDYQIILNILSNGRYSDNSNILHILISNKIILENLQTQSLCISPFKNLLYVPDNNGMTPCDICRYIHKDFIKKMLNNNILTLKDVFQISNNKLPLLYSTDILKLTFEKINLLDQENFMDIETFECFIPNIIFYLYNYVDDNTNINGPVIETIDEICNMTDIFSKICLMINKVEDFESFLNKEICYYNSHSYPILYFLSSVGFHEDFFEKSELVEWSNKSHQFEKILLEYPFLLPGHDIVIDHYFSFENIINKLSMANKTNYLDIFFESILNSMDLFESYLVDHNNLNFLRKSLLSLGINKYPYNILNIFVTFMHNEIPPDSIFKNLNITNAETLIQLAIDMYVKDIRETLPIVATPLFEWIYKINKNLLMTILEKSERWPIFFINGRNNTPLFNFVVNNILSENISTNTIFGDSIDHLPIIFTKYIEGSSIMYNLLITTSHLNTYYFENFDTLHNLLCLRDVRISKAISLLPDFQSNVFFDRYHDQDIFSKSFEANDLNYCKFILDNFTPSVEYNLKFVKTINLLKSIDLTFLLLQKKIICFRSYENIDDYIKTIKIIVNIDKSLEYIEKFTSTEIDNIFEFEQTEILTIFLENGNYIDLLCNQINSSNIFKFVIGHNIHGIINMLPNYNFKLSECLIDNNIINEQEIIKLLDPMIINNENMFLKVITKFKLIKLLTEENLSDMSFIIKVINIEKSFEHLLDLLSNNLYLNDLFQTIEYFSSKNIDIIDKFINNYNQTNNEKIIKILLVINPSLISNLMINDLIDFDKNDIIIQCLRSNVSFSNCNILKIIKKFPECSLLISNYKEFIIEMNDIDILQLIQSSFITEDIQNFILEHLEFNNKFETLSECLSVIHIESSFIVLHAETIKKLIQLTQEIFYNFIRNNIFVNEYMYILDSTENYILPTIPDGYLSESIINQFIFSLQFADLIKRDTYGRYVINNIAQSNFLDYLIKRDDIYLLLSYDTEISKLLIDKLVQNNYEFLENISKITQLDSLKNNKNQNIPMMLLNYYKYENFLHYLNNYININTLRHVDNNGCNLLFNALLHESIFEHVLTKYIEIIGTEFVKIHNNNFETLLMFSIKNNYISNFQMLLQNDVFKNEQNYVYKNTGSVLTYGVQYLNESQFKTLLSWKYIDNTNLEITQKFELYDWFSGLDPLTHKTTTCGTLLILACYYNGYILKNILKHFENNKLIKTILSKEQITIGSFQYNAIEFAYLYNPDSFQHLLSLPYVNSLIKSHSFFSNYYNVQPASWFHYIHSDIYTNTIVDQYSLGYDLRPNNIKSIASIVQSKQECPTSSIDACEICSIGKKKILFGCLLHSTCVKCGCMIENCPVCRNKDHEKKIKIYN